MSAETAVRERSILFSGEMVRALLEGRKTQTRRVLGVQPLEILLPTDHRASSLARVTRKWDGKRVWFALTVRGETIKENRGVAFRCKYGEVGDRLWVRETWAKAGEVGDHTEYRATNDDPTSAKWRPSIHMPRWASRLTLEITDVRVERVQDISEADAKAEGIEHDGTWWRAGTHPVKGSLQCWPSPRRAYQRLWDELNAKRNGGAYSWANNPFVWCLSFRVVRSVTSLPMTPERAR